MRILLVLVLTVAAPLGAATTSNDDSCDIGLYPAATLLLPYFEVTVNPTSSRVENTIFTITNVGPLPQAARVTLWTDYAYPVVAFDLYLTGYDVQKVSLSDVINRGIIRADDSPTGDLSGDDNPLLDEDTCAGAPRTLPDVYIKRMQSAFTTGKIPETGSSPRCNTAGGAHEYAAGYATVDVVVSCSASLPVDPTYFTNSIRFDNVLMGDYIQVSGENQYAQGNPMVHIRAIPEGGQQSTRKKTSLPRTFYSRLQPGSNHTLDARQPLPSTFAARYIERGTFETLFKIWREANTASDTACTSYPLRSLMPYEAVRFDEEENAEGYGFEPLIIPIPENRPIPPAALIDTTNEAIFPPNTMNTVAGWMYLNLHNLTTPGASQNWVTVSMRAENRFSVDLDAIPLGNGCSPAVPESKGSDGTHVIGPAPNRP